MTVQGIQTPTYRWAADWQTTAGIEACQFSTANGLVLDPWQQNFMYDGCAENEDGDWANNEAGMILGRQNGKGSIIEARQMAGVFLFEERLLLHSAHQQKTSNDAFNRMLTIVQSAADLDRRLVAVSRSKGEEGLTFRLSKTDRNGNQQVWQSRIRYMTRTGSAGRGLTRASVVFLDESMILDEGPVAALLPTMATMGTRWQVFYTASAGDRRLPTSSRVLARVRRRGLARETGLVLHMWEAHLKHNDKCPDDCTLDRRDSVETYAKTNPTLNRVRPDGSTGVTQVFLDKMRKAMATWDFDREFLGVGDYPSDEGWAVFSGELWAAGMASADEYAQIQLDGAPRPFYVGIESTWDRESTAVSIGAMRSDGKWHWELLKLGAGTAWVTDYCVALNAKRPGAFGIDPKGPCAHLIPALQTATKPNGRPARLPVFLPSLPQYTVACATVLTTVMETGAFIHLGQDDLTDAVRVVEKRDLGNGTFAWQRLDTTGNVAPIISVTMAVAAQIASGGRRTGRPLVASA